MTINPKEISIFVFRV